MNFLCFGWNMIFYEPISGNIDKTRKSKNKLQDLFATSANNPQFFHKPSFFLLLWFIALRFLLFFRIIFRLLLPIKLLFVRILIQILLLLLIFQFISLFVFVIKCFQILYGVEKCLSVVTYSTDWIFW